MVSSFNSPFNSLVDSLGHALIWVAGMLAACQQSTDTPARKSLDEFTAAIEAAASNERQQLKFEVLKRPDFPADFRLKIATELIDELESDASARETTEQPESPRTDSGRPENGRPETELEYLAKLGLAYGGRGTALMNRGDHEQALESFLRAEELGRSCESINPSVFFKARCNRAACLTLLGKSKEASRLLQEAIVFATPYGDQLELPFVYTLLAHHAEQSGATDMALRFLQTAFDSSVKTQKDSLAAQAGVSIVAMLVVNSQIEEAAAWSEKVASYVPKDPNPATRFTFEMLREDIRSAQGDPKSAAINLERIATEAEPTGNPQIIGNIYMSLAAAHNAANQNSEAIVAAEKAITYLETAKRSFWLAKWHRLNALFGLEKYEETLAGTDEVLIQSDQSYLRWKAFELRSHVLKKLGRLDEAFSALVEAQNEERTRLNERAREQSNFMSAVFDDQKRSVELALANERSRAAETLAEWNGAQATLQTQAALGERRLRYAIMIACAIIGLLGIICFRSLANRRTAQALIAREHQLNLELNEHLARQADELQRALAERRQLEIAIERKHRDEALGKLTGGVAHDFNSLLTVIVQSIELIKMSSRGLDDRTLKLLDSSLKAAESGAGIISQLLAYARQQPLVAKRFNVGQWLETSQSMFHQMAGKRAEIRITDTAKAAYLSADSSRLTTAIINLLANARDAIDPIDGMVSLRVDTLQIDASAATQWADVSPGEYIFFEVSDNGKGMSPEQLAHACEPFFSTKTASTGTGLGLSSVVGFVKQSAGEFHLNSVKNQGTVAQFILPASSTIEQSDVLQNLPAVDFRANEAGNNESANSENVLLVEDQDDVRFVIGLSLRSMGLNVIEASNAEEATALLSHKMKLKCVLTDVRMPGAMNGVELRRWVMSHYKNLPVVLMSGHSESNSGLEPDAIFLQKPIKPLDLRTVLDAL